MNQFEAQNAWLQGHMLKTVTTIIAFLQQRTPLAAKPELNVAQNFYYLLTGALPTLEQTQIMNRVLVLHADHDLNASTFTSRVVASTESDTVSCLTAAVCALKGPLHGGANEAVFEMLSELKQAVTDTETTVADFIQLKLNRKEKIPGFGHRIYKNGDPRATYLKQSAEKITKLNHQRVWFELSEQVCQVVADRLNLKPNVDFYTATIYHCLGLPANVFTLLFAVCRTGGWLAHIRIFMNNGRYIS
ncbi:hypothetical protein FHQ08_07530 [Lactobacillus sp. CC-MHH1034]|uniref:citrate/2-methylcitrate synthase n=1 Tax=Agrilactobacillus fermenti TaxID=2586909 RepID=UPI0022A9B941|nr:citrate/2-methylcitrate synthase [Agrilactobacillus fermenti]MCD2256571.1 hypothetical protein [Agrilactobacillus fermenti]